MNEEFEDLSVEEILEIHRKRKVLQRKVVVAALRGFLLTIRGIMEEIESDPRAEYTTEGLEWLIEELGMISDDFKVVMSEIDEDITLN